MDEAWVRLALIGGALVVAALATTIIRLRARGGPRRLHETGLAPGVYLFTSSACPDCSSVRRALTEALGEGGFEERSWESEPGVFHRLGVDAVPATMIVGEDGSGTVWPGRADDALAELGY